MPITVNVEALRLVTKAAKDLMYKRTRRLLLGTDRRDHDDWKELDTAIFMLSKSITTHDDEKQMKFQVYLRATIVKDFTADSPEEAKRLAMEDSDNGNTKGWDFCYLSKNDDVKILEVCEGEYGGCWKDEI